MSANSIESKLISLATAEEKLEFFFNNFSERSLVDLFRKHVPEKEELGDPWHSMLISLIECLMRLHVHDRDAGLKTSASFEAYQELDALQAKLEELGSAPVGYWVNLYLSSIPKSESKEKAGQKIHRQMMKMIRSMVEKIYQQLDGGGNGKEGTKNPKIGDVIAEGPGFDVIIGPQYRNAVRYYDEKMAVVLIHDPRDGHFLLIERYCPLSGGFLLELPKVPPCHVAQKKAAAENLVKDLYGLALRDLEVIGSVQPDSLIIKGVCDVYYGNYDLEETIKLGDPSVRSIKRVNEDGIYQAAFDGRLTCAVTLSAISIWRAFEPVRKKRIANSRRVRGPKDEDDSED